MIGSVVADVFRLDQGPTVLALLAAVVDVGADDADSDSDSEEATGAEAERHGPDAN
jgi:hypothetical protein